MNWKSRKRILRILCWSLKFAKAIVVSHWVRAPNQIILKEKNNTVLWMIVLCVKSARSQHCQEPIIRRTSYLLARSLICSLYQWWNIKGQPISQTQNLNVSSAGLCMTLGINWAGTWGSKVTTQIVRAALTASLTVGQTTRNTWRRFTMARHYTDASSAQKFAKAQISGRNISCASTTKASSAMNVTWCFQLNQRDRVTNIGSTRLK